MSYLLSHQFTVNTSLIYYVKYKTDKTIHLFIKFELTKRIIIKICLSDCNGEFSLLNIEIIFIGSDIFRIVCFFLSK